MVRIDGCAVSIDDDDALYTVSGTLNPDERRPPNRIVDVRVWSIPNGPRVDKIAVFDLRLSSGRIVAAVADPDHVPFMEYLVKTGRWPND